MRLAFSGKRLERKVVNMLIALLSWCSVAVLAQDATKQDAPAVTYDAPWRPEGQYTLIDPRSYPGDAENFDFTATFPNYWGSYSASGNGETSPTREDGVSGFDYGQVLSSPTFQAASGGDDSNNTYPYIYPLDPLEVTRQAPRSYETSLQSSGPSLPSSARPSEPSLTSTTRPSEPIPQSPSDVQAVFPMFYSPGFSISARRRYTNEAVDDQVTQQPATNATEPLSSSYEETFTRLIPPMPVTGMPMPTGGMLSYGGFGYPTRFFPFPPGFVPPGAPAPPSTPRGLPPADDRREEARLFGQRRPGVENLEDRTASVLGNPGLYGAPMNVPNPYFFPYLRPGLQPPMFQRYAGPPLIPARDPTSRPVPELPVAPAEAANEVVPPPFPPPPFLQRFPPGWRPPVLPGFVPRFLPPLAPPEAAALPVDNPPAPAVVDRLPLDATGDAVPVPPPVAAEPPKAPDGPVPPSVPYEFGYDMNDGKGTDQHRVEMSNGAGEVRGSYGYRDLFGVYRLVNYVADKNGFRAIVKSNEPGVASAGSADVIVQAEVPPPHAVEESLRASEPEASVVQGLEAEVVV